MFTGCWQKKGVSTTGLLLLFGIFLGGGYLGGNSFWIFPSSCWLFMALAFFLFLPYLLFCDTFGGGRKVCFFNNNDSDHTGWAGYI